jgi:hypothetical protein
MFSQTEAHVLSTLHLRKFMQEYPDLHVRGRNQQQGEGDKVAFT